MRTIKGVGFALVTFVLLFILIGLFLSDTQVVKKKVWLKANKMQLDSLFQLPSNWSKWHDQLKDNEHVVITLLDDDKGIRVQKPNGQISTLTIDSIADYFISFDVKTNAEEPISATTVITYPEVDEGTYDVQIAITYYLGNNPIYRFFGLGFDNIMEPEIAAHLSNIQEIVEE